MTLSGSTTVYGLFGDPVEHSMSPHMQTAAMETMDFNGVYVPFHVKHEHLEDAVRGIVAFGIRGINITVPHKTSVIDYLDRLTDAAQAIGAVNTIINDNGVLTGDNTDVYGFVQGLLREKDVKAFPERVCIIGAGGAARGVVYGCTTRDEVEEIVILNRTLSKAETLAAEFTGLTGKRISAVPLHQNSLDTIIPSAGLVVNTTSIGLTPKTDVSPVPDPSLFHCGQIVYDIVIPPPETKLLREAAGFGARTVSGLSMLALQGARSLSLWTGRDAPEEFMVATLQEMFEGK